MAKRKKVHKHHTVGFSETDLIDWHLRNLWAGGWTTIREMSKTAHIQHHRRKRKKKPLRYTKEERKAAIWLPAANAS